MAQLSHRPCPDQDNCGSSDGYTFNTDSKLGHCFVCECSTFVSNGATYIKNKNGKARKVDTDLTDVFDMDSTPQSGNSEYRPMRGISKSTMEFYGVKTYKDHKWKFRIKGTSDYEEGKSDEIQFVYPSGKKKLRRLDLEKSHPAHFAISGGGIHELFGMNLFTPGGKFVTIVEGEFDALAAYQILNKGKQYINPVVSIPTASPSGKTWLNSKAWLDSFDKIIVSADNDEPGQKVLQELFDLFPNKVHVMNHGEHKDANDFLRAGDDKAYINAWWNAKKYSPAGFTAAKEDWAKVLREEEPYTYIETPIQAFNDKARGIVKGGITILKAPPGTGKSSLLRMLQHDLVSHKDCVVGSLMMEEQKSTTGRAMATYQLGANVNTKEDAEASGYTEEQVIEALMEVVGDEKFISFEINPQDPIEDCLRQCKYAVTIYGAEVIFIDHLQRLAYLCGTDSATNSLTELGVKLTEFAKRRNVAIVCISHVNADGRTKYASSIEEEAIMLIEMSRDKLSDDPLERNRTHLTISKNRPYAKTGEAGVLEYDEDTTMVSEFDPDADPFDIPVMDKGGVVTVDRSTPDDDLPF